MSYELTLRDNFIQTKVKKLNVKTYTFLFRLVNESAQCPIQHRRLRKWKKMATKCRRRKVITDYSYSQTPFTSTFHSSSFLLYSSSSTFPSSSFLSISLIFSLPTFLVYNQNYWFIHVQYKEKLTSTKDLYVKHEFTSDLNNKVSI